MRLIADGGSTKTEWIILDNQVVVCRFLTNGFNPNYTDAETISTIIREAFPNNFPYEITDINYYGSGCGSSSNCNTLKDIFLQRFPKAKVSVTHDLMAAAHALFGHEKGIACILGTGANACVYDGKDVVETAVSLGYLVGDEGSGTNIGKAVARSYYYGFMPDDLSEAFDNQYHLTLKAFVERLYHQPQPNLFLSEFARFAGTHKEHPFIKELCTQCFNEFIEAFVCRFSDCKNLTISFVGSVAFQFQEILRSCLEEKGLQIGEITKSPIDGLIAYYRELRISKF